MHVEFISLMNRESEHSPWLFALQAEGGGRVPLGAEQGIRGVYEGGSGGDGKDHCLSWDKSSDRSHRSGVGRTE